MQNDNNFVAVSKPSKTWFFVSIGLIILSIGLLIFGIWSFMNYSDQKTDVDSRIAIAVAAAVNDQVIADEKKFDDREKQPNREFVGPDDYGQVRFDYPKTWSFYIKSDASKGGAYEAVMNPVFVSSTAVQYALRVTIEQKEYDQVVNSFNSLVTKGDLKASSVSANGSTGTRLDGIFSKDVRGSLVLFKIRDKTLTIRTDAEVFRSDFDSLIATIKFNQ